MIPTHRTSSVLAACLVVATPLSAQGATRSTAASKPTSRPARPSTQTPNAAVRALLDEWKSSVRDLRTLRVEFDQEKHLRILRRPRVSKGTALMDGRRLLLTVTDAKDRRETELLVDDGEVRIHYPKLRKLEIFPADASTKRKPPFPMIVDDIEQLTRDNELSLERDGTAKILVMEPRDKSSQFERIRIRFESGQMKRIEQSSRRGDRVVLRISKFTVNPKIDPKTLRLDVPRGTKVERIGAAPAKK